MRFFLLRERICGKGKEQVILEVEEWIWMAQFLYLCPASFACLQFFVEFELALLFWVLFSFLLLVPCTSATDFSAFFLTILWSIIWLFIYLFSNNAYEEAPAGRLSWLVTPLVVLTLHSVPLVILGDSGCTFCFYNCWFIFRSYMKKEVVPKLNRKLSAPFSLGQGSYNCRNARQARLTRRNPKFSCFRSKIVGEK